VDDRGGYQGPTGSWCHPQGTYIEVGLFWLCIRSLLTPVFFFRLLVQDFEKGFIKAETTSYVDLVENGGEQVSLCSVLGLFWHCTKSLLTWTWLKMAESRSLCSLY
jgi:hypothetical protein